MESTTENVEIFQLTGWDEEFLPSVRPLLFAIMFQKAAPIIEHFHGDLYHDARWISEHVNGECSFWWGPRRWGSFIGTDGPLIHAGGLPEGLAFYRIDIFKRDRGMWCARFTLTDPADAVDLTPTV